MFKQAKRFRDFLTTEGGRASAITLALLLVLVARLCFVLIYRGGDFNPSGEMTSWSRIALNLVNGSGYVYDRDMPTARRGPVPVLIMAAQFWLFGPQAFPNLIVVNQWFYDVISATLIYCIVMRLFQRRWAAVLAMIIFALHPVVIENSSRVNVEPLATCLLLAFLLAFFRALHQPGWRRFALSGLMLGLSIHSLSTIQFFPFVAIGFIWWCLRFGEQGKLAIVAFCLALLSVWAPWIGRNYRSLGALVPTTTLAGHNLLRDQQTLSEDDYLRFRYAEENEANQIHLLVQQGYDVDVISETERDRMFRIAALDMIRAYPDRYLILTSVRLARLWLGLGLGSRVSLMSCVASLVNGPLIILALWAVVHRRQTWFRSVWLLPALLVYGTTAYVTTVADVRYSIPFTPSMIILACSSLIR